MNRNTFFHYLCLSLALLLLLLTMACGGADQEAMAPAPVEEEAAPAEAAYYEDEVGAETGEEAAAEPAPAATPDSSASRISDTPNVYNRLIIKNAEVELLVEDTDTAINRSLGIVTEYGGYVVSNRTWFSGELKYATLSLGVPAENFEEMLRRLKDLAIGVTNETVSGQDVTDEYVDLESRLRNLEATAGRIREFLDQARDVEESLRVSNQLSEIEGQIEQVKGRMAYLKDRAAFSTITLQFTPQPPQPSPTPSPTPTATPVPWSVTQTIDRATGVTSSLATALYQVTVEVVVWLVIVILPFLVPIGGLIWLAVRLARRMGLGKAVTPPS